MSVDLIGCPYTVAAQMDKVMQEVGGDGFLLALGNVNRCNVAEITDGLVRQAYSATHLRDNLLEF